MYCTPYLISGNVVSLMGTCFYRSNLFGRPCIIHLNRFSSEMDSPEVKKLLALLIFLFVLKTEATMAYRIERKGTK